MGYDGDLKFNTKIDEAGFNAGISKLGSLAKGGLKIVTGAIAGVTGAVGAGVAASVKVGASFEAEMSKVSAISGAAGSDLEALTEKAKEMGAKTKFSATESGEAMEYMAMAGWKTKDMLNGVEGIMNLAAASGEDLATTSDIVTDALTAFGLQAKDSTHFADVLAQASSNANTNVGMMGDTFKYVAPVAGSLGFSAEDTAVAIGLMANSGIKASQAGTSLRSIMTRLASPTDDVKAAMDKIGVSVTDSSGKMKSLDTITGDLRKGFSGLSEAEQAQVASTIAGQEGMSGLLAIVNSSDKDFNKLKESIYNCDGAAQSMAETMQNNLQGQLTILKSSLEGLGIEIYDSIKGPLTGLAKEGINAVNQLTEAFKEGGTSGLIQTGSQIVADLLTGIAEGAPKAVEIAVDIINAVVNSLSSQSPAFVSAGGQLITAFVNGVTQILPALGNLGMRMIMQISSQLTANAPKMVRAAIPVIQSFTNGIVQNLPRLLTAAGQIISTLLGGVMQAAPTIMSSGVKIIQQIGDSISSAAPSLIPRAMEMIGQLAMGLIQNLPQLISTGIQIITAIAQGIINSIPQLITYVPQIINGLCAALDTGLMQLLAAGAKIIVNLVQGIIQAIPQLIAALPQIVLAIINVFTHINLLSAGKALITSLKNGVVAAKGGVVSAFNSLVKSLWTKVTTTNWLSLGKSILTKLIAGIKSLIGSAGSAAKSIATKILSTIRNTNWLALGKTIISKLVSGLISLAGKMVSTAKSLANKAVTAFRNIKWADVGKNIIKGIIGGIGSAASALFNKAREVASGALSAIKKKLGIKSPSRVFKKEVGKHIVTGIIAGIKAEQKSLTKTMESLCNAAIKSAKSASKNGNFSEIGKTFAENLSNSMDSQVEKTTTAGKNLINTQIKKGSDKESKKYDKKIASLNKQIKKAKKDKKSTKDLEKELKKTKAKKKAMTSSYTNLGKAMITAYTNSVKKQAAAIVKEAEKTIEELSEKFQEKYNDIMQKQSDMVSKMRDTGSLYDLDGNIEAIENYQNRIKSLKGKIPDSLMDEILGMGVSDANDYMEYLQSLDPKQFQDYINKWNKIYNGSESFGESFFKSDLDKLQEDYQKELNTNLNALKKKVNQIGKDTMAGFTSGMKSQTKNMSKAVKQMCNQIIKDMKKQLKIKSPSRVVRDKVGKYLPLGLSSAFSKYMPIATVQIEKQINTSLAAMRAKVESVEYPTPDVPSYTGPSGGAQVVVLEDSRPVQVNAEITGTVELDGKTTGKLIAPHVSKELGKEQGKVERRN